MTDRSEPDADPEHERWLEALEASGREYAAARRRSNLILVLDLIIATLPLLAVAMYFVFGSRPR